MRKLLTMGDAPRITFHAQIVGYRCASNNPSSTGFIFVDEVPGLGVLGPNYEDLLDRLKAAAGNLFRARGETVTDIKIIPSERPALQVFH
jgi:hypothetical protein